MTRERDNERQRARVVVVGGGFAGISVVRALKAAPVDVTLIDRHTYNTFKPLLYQVATASLNPGDVTWFLRAIRAKQDNVRFIKGTVKAIDHEGQSLRLAGGRVIGYDYLILAIGVTANDFGVPGVAEHAIPLYERTQALDFRNQMITDLEDFAINGQNQDLRVVVVGGGATGVETAGALAELRNHDLPVTYPELDPARVHVTLVEMGPSVLAPMHEKLRRYAQKALETRGVDLRLNTAVTEVREHEVVLKTGDGTSEVLRAGLVVWASGVTVHGVVAGWGLPQGTSGRIEVDEHQRIKGFDKEFAVGDVSVGPIPLVQQAQPAIQTGRHVGRVIAAEVAGKAMPKAFRYKDKGSLSVIGRGAAVAEVKHMPLMTGVLAWWVWLVVHIASLLGARNRAATMTNFTVKYLFSNGHDAIVGETPDIVARNTAGQAEALKHGEQPPD